MTTIAFDGETIASDSFMDARGIRMRRHLQKVSPNDNVIAQAVDYLNRNNLHGSPLREGE
jgi:hypothetical protein